MTYASRLLFLMLPAVALSGCLATTTPMSEEELSEMAKPLICKGAEQCSVYWKKAQIFVIQRSGYKIQTATDTVIETYNPDKYSDTWGFRVINEPIDASSSRILLLPVCGQVPLCREDPGRVIVSFKRYVTGAPTSEVGGKIESRLIK